MKKVLSLLTLLLAVCSGAWADDVYKITFNGSDAQSTTGYFTNGGNHNFNTKFNGCTYDGVTYTSGLKMEGSTTVSWTSTATATVTIVQSTWETKSAIQTIKLDGVALDQSTADKSTTGCIIYTITDVVAGSHSMTRGSGESGVFAIHVKYTGSVKTQLTAPEISFNSSTGDVTIGSVTNAVKVTYTTNGSDPTASSTEYTGSFTANDGDVIKAIAIGDDVSYINSSIASQQILLTGIIIEAPVINQYNGTVVITCASPNATVEYSTDGGSNWTTYSRAFTLTANTDIKARASRESCTTSDVTEATITAVAANLKSKTLVLGYGAFEGSGKVLTGKTTDIANGYTLTMVTDQDKSWSGRNKITISEISEERTTFCGSNGVQCQLDMPAGVKATQLRLYSYVNSATSTTNCAWKEVNGENLNGTLSTVPMGAFSDVADYQTNPDVRVFPLDNVEGSITFTNGGLQTCFVMVLDIIEPDVVVTPTKEYTTFCSTTPLDFTNVEGLEAYVVSTSNATTATLTKVNKVPAGTGLILKKTDTSANYNVPAATSTDTFTNLLVGVTADTELVADQAYVLSNGTFVKAAAGTLSAGKAYLPASEVSGARTLILVFEGETTGINAIENAETINGIFNLNGQRVSQPTRGLYIVNGKKVIVK